MSFYVTYAGARPRRPDHALRVVTDDGRAFHVLRFEDRAVAEQVARQRGVLVHADERAAFSDALERYRDA